MPMRSLPTRSLPDYCYAVLPSNGQLIRIDRDESGYCAITMGAEKRHVFGDEAEELMNTLNNAKGVTYPQREAMFQGSMFGWDGPCADPTHPINQPKHAMN